jgi:hypothetical protein
MLIKEKRQVFSNTAKQCLVTLIAAVVVFTFSARDTNAATLLTGWDFQTTMNGGTQARAAPNSPLVYSANFGSGTIYLNGTNGSSSFTSPSSNPEVTGFGGTAVNAGSGFSTSTSGASALAIANSSANSKSIAVTFSTVGYAGISFSYATQRTTTGFNTQALSYSVDGGGNFVSVVTPAFTPPASYGSRSVDLSAITALNDVTNVILLITLNGATNSSGNNRFDNIQLNAAEAAPEPTTAALFCLSGSFLLGLRRRKSLR